MALNRLLRTLGLVLVGAGVLVLLFAAFQLWGTGIFEAHSQSQLRSTLHHTLPPRALQPSDPGDILSPSSDSGPPKVAVPAAAPAAGKALGVIDIPSIGLNQVVVEGVGESDLRLGPGHYPGTPLPGELGNSSIAGHRTTYGHPFYNLNAVRVGAPIELITRQGTFVYSTRWLHVVSPSDTSVLAPASTPILTLTTCNPRYSASQRLILRAVLVRSRLTGSGEHGPPPPAAHVSPSELAGGGGGGDWVPVVLWGVLAAAVGTATLLVARRFDRRWPLYLGGTVVLLVVLFFFFASISPLLPSAL